MKIMVLFVLTVFLAGSGSAQLKSQVEDQQNVSNSMVRPFSGTSFMGFFDPNRFSMNQNISVGYVSGGGMGMSLASYTNSMNYQISDPLNVRMDVTLQGSPFGSSNANLQNNLSKLFISNAELNYRISNNMQLRFQYQQLPYSQWMMNDPLGSYRSPFLYGGN